MKIISLLMIGTLLYGCSMTKSQKDSADSLAKKFPPQLWSDHKLLDYSVDGCVLKAYSALSSLGFSGIVQNANFTYGNFNDNRAAVKCVELSAGSFVYFAVAGTDRDFVEKLRNEIARKF